MESRVFLNVSGHPFAAMCRQPIPHQDDRCLQCALKLMQEGDQDWGCDVGMGVEPKEEAYSVAPGMDRKRCNNADLLMRAGTLSQCGRLSTAAPAAPQQWRHQKACFVEKNKARPQARGVFFTRGQRSLIHCLMVCSSRSMARRCGFCGLQPRLCRSRPT